MEPEIVYDRFEPVHLRPRDSVIITFRSGGLIMETVVIRASKSMTIQYTDLFGQYRIPPMDRYHHSISVAEYLSVAWGDNDMMMTFGAWRDLDMMDWFFYNHKKPLATCVGTIQPNRNRHIRPTLLQTIRRKILRWVEKIDDKIYVPKL